MEKVFSTYKYLESIIIVSILFPKTTETALKTWVPQCEGKTLKECNSLGYRIADEWLVNEDEYIPYQTND